uniref:Uncharacterized protein n=1 Tax=Ditylum brightwellii TaxID=49249 RepID=A0A7S4R8E8_9STRA|mmetsp:Transcript_67258/g.99683  ORF Transcript_67258/g.99683 Transcript_67258/m.99683 type:complete len:252 (-) Transcript_67258:134-889(-)
MRLILLLFSVILNSVHAWGASAAAASTAAVALKDYTGVASGLFNNMRTPAALVGGAVVPMGIITAPKIEETDSPKMRVMKRVSLILAILSLMSEILAITYSTVAINKLAELQYEPTGCVNELIESHHKLAWIGTNIHFLFGLFGFGILAIFKSYFMYGSRVGNVIAYWGSAAMLLCTSIVNQGIAQGGGEQGTKYGSNLLGLAVNYVGLILKYARGGVMPAISVGLVLLSIVPLMKLFRAEEEDEEKAKVN